MFWWGFGRRIIYALHLLLQQQNRIIINQGTIMADLSKLQTAVARLETAVSNLPPAPPDQTAEVDALAGRVDTASATLEARATPPTT